MSTVRRILSVAALLALVAPLSLSAETRGRITAVGGVFFKSKDPKALMAWYRDVLRIDVEAWGGAMLAYDAPDHPATLTLNAFKETSEHRAPSSRAFMLTFAVDDLSAFLDRLKAKGVTVLKRDDSDASGADIGPAH